MRRIGKITAEPSVPAVLSLASQRYRSARVHQHTHEITIRKSFQPCHTFPFNVFLLLCAWIFSRFFSLYQGLLAFPIAVVFSFFVSLLLTRITYNNKIKEMENFTTDED